MIAAAAISGCLAVEDWTQWRGPNRDGIIPASSGAAKPWPEKLKPVWKVIVGEGHSSPIVVGGRVYQFSRQGEREVLAAIDLATGKKLWESGYDAPYQMNSAARGHGKGPKSTPLAAGGKVYTLGISGILTAFDAASGKTLWSHDFRKSYKATSPLFGSAASPVLDSGRLIVHVGGHDSGGLTAFDPNSGSQKWEWKSDGPGYASAVIAELAGRRQAITQSQENVIGVAVDTGELLWKLPFTTPYVQNIVTPLVVGDLLILSGLQNPTSAVRVKREGQRYVSEQVWSNREVSMYMNSPVMVNGLVYGFSHRNKGQFFALDAKTGKTAWTSEGRQAENAAMIARGDTVFALTTNSELLVMKASPRGLETVRRYEVASSPTWAHPVVLCDRVLVKDLDSLALLSGE
jgi:outer membrane protein assembly factor BamB